MIENMISLEELREPAEPLKFISDTGLLREEGDAIIEKLIKAMNADDQLLTLSAPQIGINKRIFGIRFNDAIKIFIDPIITKKADYKIAPETFSAMPGKEILISRPEELTVVYYNEDYKYEENKLLGPAARLFDQQAQLLDGILPDVLGLVSDVEKDGSLADLTDEEITSLIDFYKNYVKVKTDSIKAEIDANPELLKQYKQLEFSEKVVNGQAAIVENEDPKMRQKVQAKTALRVKDWANIDKAKNQAKLKQFLKSKQRGK